MLTAHCCSIRVSSVRTVTGVRFCTFLWMHAYYDTFAQPRLGMILIISERAVTILTGIGGFCLAWD
jgi:hypothetical protein